ncbi:MULTISPECIES: methyltransferase domain-containing protein [unclassified Microcoleus]|uniref:methyltransferase domain-containing protein n=1 Tax=unclassified Microcoleus TaxID=2642155 RepID=UPI0025F40135|nr:MULTISPECIES: methyltransferase domain-containing protein [unclassified Microcoleus]
MREAFALPFPKASYPVINRPTNLNGGNMVFGAVDEHWCRVVMNCETRNIVKSLQPDRLNTLEISGDSWGKLESFQSYKSLNYPEFDICECCLDQTFDLIIAEQIFEHLLWPYRAGKNIYQMLDKNGYFLITIPFLIRIHDYPNDCSRWTETGIKYLLAECGFNLERIQTGSWGNRACIVANFSKWEYYNASIHSLANEPDFPLVVWALAQK